MKKNAPDISVIMAVFNGEKFLRETLDSIAFQTFDNFEVIIIDDCSTDSTAEILASYQKSDDRIRVFKNRENMGLARSLNRAIELARGKYIARMDADDICLKERFERQYEFMERHPQTDLSFCRFFSMRDGELIPGCIGRKTDPQSIKAMFLFFCPVLHPGVIVKSSVMKRYRYDPEHTCSEDLDLWTRMICDRVTIEACEDFLMLYRIHGGSITANSTEKQKKEVVLCERFFYGKMLSPIPDNLESFYINSVYFKEDLDLNKLYHFYKFIIAQNRKKGSFSKQSIIDGLYEVLAEYNRKHDFGLAEKLSLFRFGGFGLAVSLVQKKKRAKKDIRSAVKTAIQYGFKPVKYINGLPIYRLEKKQNEK